MIAFALLSIGSEPARAGSDVAADVKKPDNVCHLVNQAAINTRKTKVYRETISIIEPDGSAKFFQEGRMTATGSFAKLNANSKWQKMPGPVPAVTEYPRYTSCTYVDNTEGPHFRAYWHNRGRRYETAIADVWLTPDLEKLRKTVRQFYANDPKFPSQTLLAVFDYDAEHAKPPAPEETMP